MIAWILIILGVVGLDQLTKHLVMNFFELNEKLVIIEGVFRLNRQENPGAAFGSFSEHRWIFMVVSTIGIIAMLIYLWKFRPKSKIACAALSMVIGGGIGNMIDRCFYKNADGVNVVVDFFDFYAFPNLWDAVFNVADSFVCIGAGILIVWCIWSLIVEMKAERANKKAIANSELPDVKETEEIAEAEATLEERSEADAAENGQEENEDTK